MRIVQIATAHIEQGSEPCLYGLGDDGKVYEYRIALKPLKSKDSYYEEVMMPVPEPVNPAQVASPWQRAVEPMLIPAPAPGGFIQQAAMVKKTELRYRDKFTDGWTEGWHPLEMGMSKIICHPEDPTRHERS
jgi:hypothetical protein